MTKAPDTSTNPAAGVIPTKPEITPDALPIKVGFELVENHSISNHPKPPEAAATLVTSRALAAIPSAASWLPPLNPNHPNHSKPVPNKICVTLWGGLTPSG